MVESEHMQFYAPARQLAPRRILVVDDNIDAATSTVFLLESLGHKAYSAHDGFQAVRTACWLHPHLILMDIGMPRLNGLEAARRIRMLKLSTRPLIVAVTGWGKALDRVASEEAGIDVHLIKPVDLDIIGQLLDAEEL